MARRRNADKPAEPAAQKAPVRVARRKRRKSPAGRPPQTPSRALHSDEASLDDYDAPTAPPGIAKLTRAPRPAERPPANPNVFSYTFTIWKST
jgi:hypothetical protein